MLQKDAHINRRSQSDMKKWLIMLSIGNLAFYIVAATASQIDIYKEQFG